MMKDLGCETRHDLREVRRIEQACKRIGLTGFFATTTIGRFWHEPPMIRMVVAKKQSGSFLTGGG